MATANHSVIDQVGTEVPLPQSVGNLAIFLDVDGSLIDIAETPDSVVIPDDLPAALGRISDAASGALSLVSGRSLATLDRFFAPAKLTAIGLHGGEIRLPDGRVQLAPIPPILETLRPQLAALVDRHPGALLEDKGRSLAVHYRRAPDAGPEIEDAVDALAASAGPDIALQKGKMVMELRPAGASKGSAVGELMQVGPFPGRTPLAVGDDLTDESMFAAINRLGGMTVRVGTPDRPTEATYRIASPAAVRAWLATLARSGDLP